MTVTREERELGRRQPLSVPGTYLSLTTYRRDGTPVPARGLVRRGGRAPVRHNRDRLVQGEAAAAESAAMVAPCTARGIP